MADKKMKIEPISILAVPVHGAHSRPQEPGMRGRREALDELEAKRRADAASTSVSPEAEGS